VDEQENRQKTDLRAQSYNFISNIVGMGAAHTYGQMFKSYGGFAKGGKDNQGFTLLELLVATALLGLLAGSSIWALTQANNYASIARLYTGAETAAQNQIDLILTESPFNPQANPPQIPLPLTVGTGAPQTVTLYSEPAGAGGQTHTVTGQMVTTVMSNNVVTQGQNLNLYSATVVVTYIYRSKVYRVQLNAMRASDV
jgi:prepilin-type N-terminal cleavage/methylation domain-containing protein